MSIASPSRAVLSGSGANIFNSRSFLLLCAWGTGAALALVVAVAAGRTDLGGQRARAAMTTMLSPPQSSDPQMSEQISASLGEFDRQMRRHADMIRALAEQRDGLAERVGLLERQLGELGVTLTQATTRLEGETRSAQQAAAAASAVAAASRAAQLRPDAAEGSSAVAGPAPAAALPAASQLGRAPQPPTGNLPPPGQIHPTASAAAAFPATWGGASQPQPYTGAIAPPAATETNTTPSAARSFPMQPSQSAAADPWPTAPTQPNGAKASPPVPPGPPPMFRSNPLMTTGIFAPPAEPGPAPAEFAIDLGPAPTIEALRARWAELRVSQSPLLDNLKPLIALKDGARSGQELHLVAGPLTNNSAAHRLCAVLVGTSALCQPTLYEGQRLAAR